MTTRIRIIALAAAAVALSTGCSDDTVSSSGSTAPGEGKAGGATPQSKVAQDSQGGQKPESQHPLGFGVWKSDFPQQVRLSPSHAGRWFDKTRRGVLKAVAANLSGTCSRDAWLLAKEFFTRVPAEDRDLLIEAVDRGLQANTNDIVENTLLAMALIGDESYSDVILRSLSKPTQGIQNAATRALITCGTPAAIEKAHASMPRWYGSAQIRWFEAACEKLEPNAAVGYVKAALSEPRMRSIVNDIIRHAVAHLEPQDALRALEPVVARPPDGLGPTIAGLRHAVGDASGSIAIRDLMASESPMSRALGLDALKFGGHEAFRDRILELTTDHDASVRLATIACVVRLEGSGVDDALESLALDPSVHVRQSALFQLRARGRLEMLDDLIADLRTATGNDLMSKMTDVVAARDTRAIPVIVERMKKAPAAERRGFLQSIAHMQVPASLGPLRQAFMSDPSGLGDSDAPEGSAVAVYSHLGILFLNVRGGEQQIVDLFESLESDDYLRRTVLLGTLASLAVDREDAAIASRCYESMRKVVFDTAEIPQMRLLALGHLRRGINLDDVMRLKRQARREEDRGMQRAINDFLLEFF